MSFGPVEGRRSRWWVEALALAWLLSLYDAVTNLEPLRAPAALGHAWSLLHVEQALHVAPELVLNQWLNAHHTLDVILSNYYDNAHFVVTLGLLAWLWWRRPGLYRPLRNSLVVMNLIALVVFWGWPLAPPRMLTAAGFTDSVANTQAFGSWHSGALASQANQFAAMPSLHLAWAVWCSLAIWRLSRNRVIRLLGLAYPLATSFVVMATANHYLFDVVAGLLTAALAVVIVELVPWSSVRTRLVRLRH